MKNNSILSLLIMIIAPSITAMDAPSAAPINAKTGKNFFIKSAPKQIEKSTPSTIEGTFIITKNVSDDDFKMVRYAQYSFTRDKENFVVPQERLEVSEIIFDEDDHNTVWMDAFPSKQAEKTKAGMLHYKNYLTRIIRDLKNLGYAEIEFTAIQTGKKSIITLKEKRRKSRTTALYNKKQSLLV